MRRAHGGLRRGLAQGRAGRCAVTLDIFVEVAKGILYVALAVAFLLLAWMFLRLARIFSTTEETIKEVSEQVVPLLGKTHTTVDNINSQLSQLDTAVGDVAGITGELDQTTTVITRGVRGGVISLSSATAGISKGLSTFFGRDVGEDTAGPDPGLEPEAAPGAGDDRPNVRYKSAGESPEEV